MPHRSLCAALFRAVTSTGALAQESRQGTITSFIADSSPLVGANLGVMEADTLRMRGKRPFVFTNLKRGEGVDPNADFIIDKGGLAKSAA